MANGNGKRVLSARQNIIQMSKFVIFSISAGAIQILSFTLMSELTGLPYWPKYIIALVLSVLFNFTVNRAFTFKSAKNVPLAMFQVFLYYLVFTPLSTWWGTALTGAGINQYVVLSGTMLINFGTEFSFYRFVVYRNSMYTNRAGRREMKTANGEEKQNIS